MTATLVGFGSLLVGGLTLWGAARASKHAPRGQRYRAGPWPGLSPAGGMVLLACALLLAGGQLVLGDDPDTSLRELPLLGVLAVCPLVLATRRVGMPCSASAVCGAYLLFRTLASLVDPAIPPPPLLLVPAVAFDLTSWLRASDLAGMARHLRPGRRSRWRRAKVEPRRRAGPRRSAMAGAVFGAVLATIEPPFAVLLGADPAAFPAWASAGLSTMACAVAALAMALWPDASGRGTAA